MIEVRNLTKKYDSHPAVNHISFTVEKGQVLGFLGPNGAGKSTTMNMITGYISATEGDVIINGCNVYDEPEEAKKCIGYLPELPPVYPDMTVKEYLSFVADIKKTDKKTRTKMLVDIMKRTGVYEVRERLIKHLSKGYRQRVGLAQALVGYPEVIILDEPTVGLDPAQIIEIRDLIKSLREEHTVIVSSHILSEISAVCDSVMIINKGRIIASDKPENLAERLGAAGIRIEACTDFETVKNVLDGIEAINEITLISEKKEEDGSGVTVAEIRKKDSADIRAEIFKRFVKAGIVLLELRSETRSLEEIFLEVTHEDDEKKSKKRPVKEEKKNDGNL